MSEETPRVLIVDDIEANLMVLEAVLDGLPCSLVRADSGEQALLTLKNLEFAVMLLDVQMPEMDGFEVARHVREDPRTQDLPIIFLTAGHFSNDTILKGYDSGAVDFLTKPIDPFILRSKVSVFIDLYMNRRRLEKEIDSHRRTTEKLERSNAALRHFTHAASHDLRAPLRVIQGFVEAIREDFKDNISETANDYINRCITHCTTMNALLSSLLTYAELQKAVPATRVDTKRVAERARTDLAELKAPGPVEISVDELPSVWGDEQRLYQVFLNLMGNALKFTAPGQTPRVHVGMERGDGQTRFFVEDNGIGISEKDRDHLFVAFSRLNSPSTYQGSGLGLTICSQIIEQHGGRMWVESEPGRGSRFWFEIPDRSATYFDQQRQ